MNECLLVDLERWERGLVRAEEVADHHPGRDALDLVEAHTWLSMHASDAANEPGPAWEELAPRLSTVRDADAAYDLTAAPPVTPIEPPARRRGLPVRRVVAAVVAGAMLTPASALAHGLEQVQTAARTLTREVTEVLVPAVPLAGAGATGVVVVDLPVQKTVAVTPPGPADLSDAEVVDDHDGEEGSGDQGDDLGLAVPTVPVVHTPTPSLLAPDRGTGDDPAPSVVDELLSPVTPADEQRPGHPGWKPDSGQLGSGAVDVSAPAHHPQRAHSRDRLDHPPAQVQVAASARSNSPAVMSPSENRTGGQGHAKAPAHAGARRSHRA